MTFGRVDRRAHERTRVAVPGRILLADRREYACTITDVSVGGMALTARERGEIGETVVVYVADVGRLEGQVIRHFTGGFGVKLNGMSRAADMLARRFEVA